MNGNQLNENIANLKGIEAEERNAVAKANERHFIGAVQGVNHRGLDINREILKAIDILGICFDQAEIELQSDFALIKDTDDAGDIRTYIKESLGSDALKTFQDYSGNIVLDLEHALLLYYKMKAEQHPRTRIAKGLVYFIGGHHMDEEFEKLREVINKGQIKPALVQTVNNFRWKRCPHITKRYISQLALTEGYKTYEFSIPLFHHIMFLMKVENLTMEEARAKVETAQRGFFYSFLPIEIEDALMPAILTGQFSHHLMDGYYKQALIQLERQVHNGNPEFGQNYQYNVYTRFIKPYMCEIIGSFIGLFNKMLVRDNFDNQGIYIEMVSPEHITVKVPSNVPFEQLTNATTLFRQVQPFSLNGFLVGYLLK